MPGDIVVKIDADTQAYIAKIAKMAESHEKVGKSIKDSGKHADGLKGSIADMLSGTAKLETASGGWAANLGKIGAALGGITAVAAAMRNVSDAIKAADAGAAELSRNRGAAARSLDASLAQIGFGTGDRTDLTSTLQKGGEGATPEESVGFTGSIAGIVNSQRESFAGQTVLPLDRARLALQWGNKYGPSAYQEIIRQLNMDGGRGSMLDETKLPGYAGRSEQANRENTNRNYEQGVEQDSYNRLGGEADLSRKAAAVRARRELLHPGEKGLNDTIDNWVPGSDNAMRQRDVYRGQAESAKQDDDEFLYLKNWYPSMYRKILKNDSDQQ